MKMRKRRTLKDLIEKNKQDLLSDADSIEKIERRLEEKQAFKDSK